MRRLKPALALEQEQQEQQLRSEQEAQEEGERVQAAGMSLEEELTLNAEAAMALEEVQCDLDESDRVLAVSDALEDLAIVAAHIQKANPVERALLETAGQMAVAGTPVSAQSVVPVLEAFDAREMASRLKRKAKEIWERIVKFLRQVWEKLERFFYNTLHTVPAQLRRIAELRQLVKDTPHTHQQTQEFLPLSGGAVALAIDGKTVADAHELSVGLAGLMEAAHFVYHQHLDCVVRRGHALARSIETFNFAQAGESVESVQKALNSYPLPDPPGAGAANTLRHPDFSTTRGTSLLGNIALSTKQFDPSGKEYGVLQELELYRESAVLLERTADNSETPREFKIKTIFSPQALHLLDQCETLLRVFDKFKRGGKMAEVTSARKLLEQASDRLAKEVYRTSEQAGVEGGLSDAEVAQFRAMLNFNVAMARWVKEPAADFLRSATSTVSATLMVIRKSLLTVEPETEADRRRAEKEAKKGIDIEGIVKNAADEVGAQVVSSKTH